MVDSTIGVVMGETGNRLKRNKKFRSAERERDRLSSMPDSVLCHLLSFLPTKEAVATSVLARRWRSLWTDVPCLDFNSDSPDYASPNDYSTDDDEPLNHHNSTPLSDIINRVLLLHQARSLNSFRVSFEKKYQGHYIKNIQFDSWMAVVVSRNVQTLDISLDSCYSGSSLLWPSCLFRCKTVVVMKLNGEVSIPTLHSVRLPNLKKLYLLSVIFEEDTSLPELISGCLVLEELVIERFEVDGMSYCDICSPTLKKLTMRNDFNSPVLNRLMIDTPSLQFLHLDDQISSDISVKELSSLVEADVSIRFDDFYGIDEDEYGRSVYKFLEKLDAVEVLRFSCDVEFAKPSLFAKDRCFNNLTRLNLKADWHSLGNFLESAENLEQLVIEKVDDIFKCWEEPLHVPRAMLYGLKHVTIHGFGGKEVELLIVEYILQHARLLEFMEIHHARHRSLQSKLNALQKISLFKRGSEDCRVNFS